MFFSCQSGSNNQGSTNEEAKINVASLVTDTLNISGMHCDMCVSSIEKGVNELKGIHVVNANLEDSTAVVKYDATVLKKDEIAQAIKKRGYSVKEEM